MAKKSFPAHLRDTQATLTAMLERLRKQEHAAEADAISLWYDRETDQWTLTVARWDDYRWELVSRTVGVSVQDAFETAEYGLVGDTPPPF